MCQTNNWNSILAQGIGGALKIVARRSDGLIITLTKTYIEQLSPVQQTKDIFDQLQSYKNCKCEQNDPCLLHTQIRKRNQY